MTTAVAQPASTPLLPPRSALSEQARGLWWWVLCWLVLPNLPFLPITLMGGPPRYPDVIACGLVGFLVRRWSYPLRLAAFVALMAYLVFAFIARMFNMAITMILSVAGLVFDMNPAASPEYVVGALAAILVVATGAWLLRKPTRFREPRLLIAAVAATVLLGGADYLWSRDTMGAYARLPSASAPFSSATGQSGFAGLADGRTNLMIVVVEAMGEPLDPRLRRKLDGYWMRPDLAARFEMRRGSTPYYGSTTSGELRELCGRWGTYPDVTVRWPGCLPAQLSGKGYQPVSYHAFEAGFFDRAAWYPRIGFEQSVWGEDMLKAGARLCPNVFPGACDRDVPRLIGQRLRAAAKPQFVYWLTLNSHLPTVENDALRTRDCKETGEPLDSELPMVCRLFTIWRGTADALAKEVSRPDFPPTHILIVGDHMPPFTHQKSRLLFDSQAVPWVLLKWRGTPAAQPSGR